MTYDLVVIGSGPAGYVAAIRAAQLNRKTAIVEKYPTLGGTCLNVGCIPSKALLDSSEKYFEAVHAFAEHGIGLQGISVNLEQMMRRKESVVALSVKGIDFLMRSRKIDRFQGTGSFLDKETIRIRLEDGEEKVLSARNILIATGSKSAGLRGVEIDKKRIITSTEALSLKEVPGELVVIGAGAIGLELASVYARLGSKVTVLEYMDRALPLMDGELGKELSRVLARQLKIGMEVSHRVEEAKVIGDRVQIVAAAGNGEKVTYSGDYCLVAVGRVPYTSGLQLENAGICTDQKGRIPVDEKLRTSVPTIYAVGDVIGGMMLAHKGEEEGVFVAETICGLASHISYRTIPQVVYTNPEVASVGRSEEDLQSGGISYKSGKFPFRASGRARACGQVDGFIKVLAEEATDKVLGVHMIGQRAADMIAEAVLAMDFQATAEAIARSCHPHPTFSEAFREACLAATAKRAIHI